MTREEWIAKIEQDIKANEKNQQKKLEEARLGIQPQAQPTGAASQPNPEELTLRNTSQIAVVYFDPPDRVAEVGTPFSSDVVIRCRAQRAFDVVELVFSFQPDMLRPTAVYDDQLRAHEEGKPRFETDLNEGWMRYRARLKEPMRFFTQRLLTIAWMPLKAVDSTSVALETAEMRSSVRIGAKDLLTDELLPRGGLLPLSVSVNSPRANPGRGFLLPGPASIEALPSFSGGPVWFEMVGPAEPVEPGQEFDVRIYLHNPDKSLFDLASLWIQFPADRVEILDWDRGNWIRAGVNIHDGACHETFPFDVHIRDEVSPDTGDIVYRMGASHAQISSEGLFAEIRARALAPASINDFHFVYGPKDSVVTTDVSFLGVSLVNHASAPAASTTPEP